MSTDQPYTPSLSEVVMGKTHLGDNFWRELSEDEVRRGVEAVRADAWDEGAEAAWARSTSEVNGQAYFWRTEGEPLNPHRIREQGKEQDR